MTLQAMLKPALLLTCALLSSACHVHYSGDSLAQAPLHTPGRYTLDRVVSDIVYTGPGWPQALQADLYLPSRPGPLPVVMTIHGGGWANRDRDDMEDISEALVARGYAVLNLSYRFAPRYTFPAQLDDLHQALAWIVDNADNYRLDAQRISAWGYSSGAHLAALLGSYDRAVLPLEVRQLPRLRAVIAAGFRPTCANTTTARSCSAFSAARRPRCRNVTPMPPRSTMSPPTIPRFSCTTVNSTCWCALISLRITT